MWKDEAYLLDILMAARKAREFTKGLDRFGFEGNEMVQQATLRCLEIVGEAAGHVSEEFRSLHPEIPWHEMIAFRHRLAHDYFNIDIEMVWDIVVSDLPDLTEKIGPWIPPETRPS
jgi:uncharacterized protein with HEPN domain